VDWFHTDLSSEILDQMSLSPASRALLERMRPVIAGATEGEIRRAITSDEPSALRDDELGLVREGDYSVFFAPFAWINDEADIVIVGVTPGKQQTLEALLSFSRGACRRRLP
jgi:hypothetical protein